MVTVHPQNIPTLIQTAKGNLGAIFFNRLGLMSHNREFVYGPQPGTAVLQQVPRLSRPLPRETFTQTYMLTLCNLRRCRLSLLRWLHPGTFALVDRASAQGKRASA